MVTQNQLFGRQAVVLIKFDSVRYRLTSWTLSSGTTYTTKFSSKKWHIFVSDVSAFYVNNNSYTRISSGSPAVGEYKYDHSSNTLTVNFDATDFFGGSVAPNSSSEFLIVELIIGFTNAPSYFYDGIVYNNIVISDVVLDQSQVGLDKESRLSLDNVSITFAHVYDYTKDLLNDLEFTGSSCLIYLAQRESGFGVADISLEYEGSVIQVRSTIENWTIDIEDIRNKYWKEVPTNTLSKDQWPEAKESEGTPLPELYGFVEDAKVLTLTANALTIQAKFDSADTTVDKNVTYSFSNFTSGVKLQQGDTIHWIINVTKVSQIFAGPIFVLDDGTALHNSILNDDLGYSINPTAILGGSSTIHQQMLEKQFYHRKVTIPSGSSVIGRYIASVRYYVRERSGFDAIHMAPLQSTLAYIVVTNPSGEVKLHIWSEKNGSVSDWTWYSASHPNHIIDFFKRYLFQVASHEINHAYALDLETPSQFPAIFSSMRWQTGILVSEKDTSKLRIQVWGKADTNVPYLWFTGENTYINFNSTTNDFENTNPWTMRFKLYVTRNTGNFFIYTKRESSGNYRGIEIRFVNAFPNPYIRVTICSVTSSNEIIVDTPYTVYDFPIYVTVTYDGSLNANGVTVYYGYLRQTSTIVSNTLTTSILNTVSAQIGARNGATSTGTGGVTVYDFYVYNRALSHEEITNRSGYTDIRRENSLTHYWPIDENTGTTIYDKISGGVNGSLIGSNYLWKQDENRIRMLDKTGDIIYDFLVRVAKIPFGNIDTTAFQNLNTSREYLLGFQITSITDVLRVFHEFEKSLIAFFTMNGGKISITPWSSLDDPSAPLLSQYIFDVLNYNKSEGYKSLNLAYRYRPAANEWSYILQEDVNATYKSRWTKEYGEYTTFLYDYFDAVEVSQIASAILGMEKLEISGNTHSILVNKNKLNKVKLFNFDYLPGLSSSSSTKQFWIQAIQKELLGGNVSTTIIEDKSVHVDASIHSDSDYLDHSNHSDVAHSDHSDNTHSDVAHSDYNDHANVAHQDSGHSDSAHSDHSDHSDAAHSDHQDNSHGDATHSDYTDYEDYADFDHIDFTNHLDSPHSDHTDNVHNDVAHSDYSDHSNQPHQDSTHADSPHQDSTSHQDVSHSDHSDGSHSDVAYQDYLDHSDQPHQDSSIHGDKTI